MRRGVFEQHAAAVGGGDERADVGVRREGEIQVQPGRGAAAVGVRERLGQRGRALLPLRRASALIRRMSSTIASSVSAMS